ncbi:MAG: O-antigen ligase family protein [Gammaproteobacteria bacterium]
MRGVSFSGFRPFSMEKILGGVVSILAFIFPIVVLTVNRADSVILLLLGIIGTYAFLKHGIRYLALSRQEILLIGIFAGWYATIVLCYFVGDKTDTGFKLLGRNFRFLFFIPAFIACRCYLSNTRSLFSGLVLAPFAILGLGLWQFMRGHEHTRASGFIDPIPFGDLSIAMAFMALAMLLMMLQRRTVWQYLLVSGALSAGVGASILSGTRGGWIAAPLLVIITIAIFSRRSAKRAFKVFLACSIIVVIAGFLAPNKIVQSRVSEAIQNLGHYRAYVNLIEDGDAAHVGCLNSPLFMKTLVGELKLRYSSGPEISVVEDASGLKEAGLDAQCQSLKVLKLANTNKQRAVTLIVKRSVIRQDGLQNAEFIARGEGQISIVHGNPPSWQKFNNSKYEIVKRVQNTKDLSWPAFWLPPGGTIYLVPIQNSFGEYIFPFANDSVGERLEMWRAAWHMFKQHPFFGAGTGSFRDDVEKLARAGDVSPAIMSFDHPHNDYMNVLSSQGSFGLTFYLLAIGFPLFIFIEALRSKDGQIKAAGFAGVVMITGLSVFGLTETMFIHSIVMAWYVTFTAMFMAIVFTRKGEEIRDAGN